MQLFNQIYLLLLAIILLGVLSSSTYKTGVSFQPDARKFWPVSILARIGAFVAWAASPLVGFVALELANVLFIVASITLILFIRSWRMPIRARLMGGMALLVMIFAIAFGWLLSQPNSFPSRAVLTASVATLTSLWEFYETARQSRRDNSYLIKVLLAIVLLQVILSILFITLSRFFSEMAYKVSSIIHTDVANLSVVFFWLVLGTYLLTYIVIKSYLYEKLWKTERATHEALLLNQQALSDTSLKKAQIEELLSEREQLIAGLVKANKTTSTGAMAASIAHEMSQPLAVIQMNSELLEKLNQEGRLEPESTEDILRGIRVSNSHAANIVKTLRGIFLDNAPVFERTNISQLVRSVTQLSRANIETRGIQLTINIPSDLEADIYANELFQVLVNLLNNATQALAGCACGQGRIAISGTAEGNNLLLSISDNGPGISPDMQSQLFKLFSHSGKPESMGLGLWLCAYIVERHRGKIWQENDPKGGARFFIRLPLSPSLPA